MSATQQSVDDAGTDSPQESAVLVAARQLSEEAALRPRMAGLTGLRRRDAETRTRRAARRMWILPAA